MNKKKLILTMYIGVIALAVASVSMSVAWYATSRSLYVNSIDITIDADRDLKISTSKDGGYKDHLSHQEVGATGVFLPLTSAHSSLWMSEKKDMPVFYDESMSYEHEDAQLFSVSERGYFSQKFYIMSDDDVWVTLDASKSFIHANASYIDGNEALGVEGYAQKLYNLHHHEYTAQEEANLKEDYKHSIDYYYSQYSVEDFKANLRKIASAMRFSILIKDEDEYSYTIFDPNKEEDTLLGGILDNDVDQYYDSYQKNGTNEFYERVYGEVIGDQSLYVYDEGLQEDSDYPNTNEPLNAFSARHKAGIKRFNLEKSLEKGLEIKKEESIDLKNFKSSDFRFPVRINQPKEVVISIYIEGWDKDSVDYTMGASFVSDIVFKIEREM